MAMSSPSKAGGNGFERFSVRLPRCAMQAGHGCNAVSPRIRGDGVTGPLQFGPSLSIRSPFLVRARQIISAGEALEILPAVATA